MTFDIALIVPPNSSLAKELGKREHKVSGRPVRVATATGAGVFRPYSARFFGRSAYARANERWLRQKLGQFGMRSSQARHDNGNTHPHQSASRRFIFSSSFQNSGRIVRPSVGDD